jgi:hypothetical protein
MAQVLRAVVGRYGLGTAATGLARHLPPPGPLGPRDP